LGSIRLRIERSMTGVRHRDVDAGMFCHEDVVEVTQQQGQPRVGIMHRNCWWRWRDTPLNVKLTTDPANGPTGSSAW
jgi:hypothetical protein